MSSQATNHLEASGEEIERWRLNHFVARGSQEARVAPRVAEGTALLHLQPWWAQAWPPEMSTSQTLEPVTVLPHIPQGTLQMSLRVLRWGDFPAFSGQADFNPTSP